MTEPKKRRLSSIERLPPEANGIIQWAETEFHRRSKTQSEIYNEVLERLASKGIEPPSFSAFNRWTLGLRASEAGCSPEDVLSGRSLALIASALRSVADDLERNSSFPRGE